MTKYQASKLLEKITARVLNTPSKEEKDFGLLPMLKGEVLRAYEKKESSFLSTTKRLLQRYYGPRSFIGVIGVDYIEGYYHIRGSIESRSISAKGTGNPGSKAREIVKSKLQMMLGPHPPDKGKPHRMILIPMPSFLLGLRPSKQRRFFYGWKALVKSHDLPYCEFTVLR